MRNFFKISFKAGETIVDIRKQLLVRILSILNLFGIPLVIIGIYEATVLEQYRLAISYFIIYSPVLVVTLLYNKIQINKSVIILLVSLFFFSILNLVIYGFSGASIPVFLTLLVLTTVFFDIKWGLIGIGICLASMIIIGFLYVREILVLDISLVDINSYTVSWLTASATMLLLGGLIVISYGLVQKMMMQSVKFSRNQADELVKLNKQLKDDINRRKLVEEDLEKHRGHLEEMVKESTYELERKNKELEDYNKKLEDYNELFIGREFRIKELRDKIKELRKMLVK